MPVELTEGILKEGGRLFLADALRCSCDQQAPEITSHPLTNSLINPRKFADDDGPDTWFSRNESSVFEFSIGLEDRIWIYGKAGHHVSYPREIVAPLKEAQTECVLDLADQL